MCLPKWLHIKCRIHAVYILLIQLLAQQFHGLSEALEVHHFPFPQELDDIVDVWII